MENERANGSGTASRRGFMRSAAGTAAVGATAANAGTAAAQEGAEDQFGGWMEDARNYDGEVADMTGEDEVTIAVGAGDSGLAFDPAAVRVDPGTRIVWEWTGEGGGHNVVGENRDFRSGDPVSEAGTTYEQAFEEAGVVEYYCNPHRATGMKGVVVVGEAEAGGAEGGEEGFVLTTELVALGATIVLGVLSPIVFAVFLALRRDRVSEPGSADDELRRIDSRDD